LGIGAALITLSAILWFFRRDVFEGVFAIATGAVWAWLFVDWDRRSRAKVGSARDVFPVALIFLLPTLRLVLIGQGWLREGDSFKAAWALGTAVVIAGAGGFYLWVRRRLPDHRRF